MCNMKSEELFILDFIKVLKDKLLVEQSWYAMNSSNVFAEKWQLLLDVL